MRRRMMIFGVLAAVVLGALSTTSAAAAAGYKPDGWVRYHGYYSQDFPNPHVTPGPWKGKDIYNTTALNQTAKITTYGPLDQWEYARFDVTVENDGAPSRFKIHGASKFSQYWKAFYYIGTTNITHAVEAGTYTTPSLAQGASLRSQSRSTTGRIASPAKAVGPPTACRPF